MPGSPDIPHLPRSAPIDAYGNGGFRFADMSHRGSLLCLPDSMWAWEISKPGQIDRYSLARVLERYTSIDTLLIGTGAEIWRPSEALRDVFRTRHIGIDAMQTGPAIRTFNVMIGERRRVAAALIAVP